MISSGIEVSNLNPLMLAALHAYGTQGFDGLRHQGEMQVYKPLLFGNVTKPSIEAAQCRARVELTRFEYFKAQGMNPPYPLAAHSRPKTLPKQVMVNVYYSIILMPSLFSTMFESRIRLCIFLHHTDRYILQNQCILTTFFELRYTNNQ